MMSVLLFSPVRRDPEVLKRILPTWHALLDVDEKWIYDDREQAPGGDLFKGFKVFRDWPGLALRDGYHVTEQTHNWPSTAVQRVAQIKDRAIEEFLKTDHSHLFLIDSDLAVHPGTVRNLLSLDLAIVSTVFWSQWKPDQPFLPNCWDQQPYAFNGIESLLRLTKPGTYRVGGLGACTLISREVLEAGVRFRKVVSLPANWGEDRDFCVRAQTYGYVLHVNTEYPAFHAYRDSMLLQLTAWEKAGCSRRWFEEHWLTSEWELQLRG